MSATIKESSKYGKIKQRTISYSFTTQFDNTCNQLSRYYSFMLKIYFVLLLLVVLTGCATSITHNPVPEQWLSNTSVIESSKIRFWGDEQATSFQRKELDNWLQQRRKSWENQQTEPIINFLALSGGGEDGSFAAGIVTGWTRNGDRPDFDVVTGVSAGALASPFVFLGPTYDEVLFDVYENLGEEDIYKTQFMNGIFGGTALFDTRPLKELIRRYVTKEIIQQIALEHKKGRRLWIGTTNLDAGRPVIWDIGKIAISNSPNALNLFHNILLASSAVPGLFPPVLIEVDTNNQQFTELHVDGGVTRQVFLYPSQFVEADFAETFDKNIKRRLYIIRNGRSQAIYEPVTPNVYSIALRALNITIENKAIGDLYRIYELTSRDGIDYNLAIIPSSFNQKSNSSFDPDYTRALFNTGYQLSKDGYPWEKSPPDSSANHLK